MKKYLTIIITVVIAGGAGFWGGVTYGESASFSGTGNRAAFQGLRGQGSGATGRMNGSFTGGSIVSADATGITVKLRDGSSKIIFVSSSTEIMKSVQGLASDLAAGEQVTVAGTTNSDGSVTAQSVQIRPVISGSPNQ